MWIDTVSDETLRVWAKHSPTQKIVSKLDGQILWANHAFCEWSQYTLSELLKMTWMQLSVPDANLAADIEEVKRLDAYNPSYVVKKQYIAKGSAPEWGHLTVVRYPLTGEPEYFLCTWEPLKNGTARAFTLAMEHSEKIDQRMKEMTAELKTLTTLSEEEKFWISCVSMIRKHPKIAVAFLIIALSVFGLNNVLELFQRVGIVPEIPHTVQQSPPNG